MKTIRLNVNGKPVAAAVDPRTSLADFLRDSLDLTGTHLGCEHGVCGACTINVDGMPARSCITLAVACDGAFVTTVEGLDDDEVTQALRAAFTREHALQCGYCTPGMLASARDIVLRLPEADEQEIRVAMSGNLCRCTGYVGIVQAIARVLAERRAGGARPPFTMGTELGPAGSHHAPSTPADGERPAPSAASPAAPAAPGTDSPGAPDAWGRVRAFLGGKPRR
jgi:carbon-monoxide dehydrogenase small subunit